MTQKVSDQIVGWEHSFPGEMDRDLEIIAARGELEVCSRRLERIRIQLNAYSMGAKVIRMELVKRVSRRESVEVASEIEFLRRELDTCEREIAETRRELNAKVREIRVLSGVFERASKR